MDKRGRSKSISRSGSSRGSRRSSRMSSRGTIEMGITEDLPYRLSRRRGSSRRSSRKGSSRSRSRKRVKKETDLRYYHSAHGSLSTKKKYINENEVPSTFGYPETHFVNGEKKAGQVYPIKVGKDVSGVNATIYFKINSDMCTSTRTGDNSKAETEGESLNNLDKFHILFTIEAEGKGNELIIKKVLVHSPSTASLRIGSHIIDEMTLE